MAQITKAMIEQVYEMGKLVALKEKTTNSAAQDVRKTTEMNLDSAKMYITCVVALLTNGSFGRTVKCEAMDYFLGRIYNEFGREGLRIAISAAEAHIENQKNPLHNIKSMIKGYKALLRTATLT